MSIVRITPRQGNHTLVPVGESTPVPLDCPPAPETIALDLGSRLLIAPLQGSRNTSGYRGVYPHKNGWRCVVKWGGCERRVNGKRIGGGRLLHGPVVSQPHQAAVQLALWLRARLGPRWAELYRAHPRHLWRLYAPFKCFQSKRNPNRWHLGVWVQGVWEEVRDRHGALLAFGSWTEAADFVPVYMREKHGSDWWGKLWR